MRQSLKEFRAYPNSMTAGKMVGATYKIILVFYLALTTSLGYQWLMKYLESVRAFTNSKARKYDTYNP